MVVRQLMAWSLAILLATAPIFAQQGAISGIATDEAEAPYSDYSVRLVNPATGQIVGTPQVLDSEGRFSFSNLTLGQEYMVELINTADNNDVVCAEGPFGLNEDTVAHTGINIDCGRKPAALYVVLGAGALAAVVGVLNQSNSQ